VRNPSFALLTFFLLVSASGAAPYNLSRAIAEQRALASDRPNDAAVQNDLGNLLVLAEDNAAAEAAYRKAIELDPKNVSPHFNLGLLLEKRDARAAALKEFHKVLDIDPGHAWAHYQVGVIYQDWGLKPLARRQFARALALDARLANPAVNPHMIENPLGTKAMIDAYHSHSQGLQPPHTYEEPARIARLMIDSQEAAPADQQAAAPEPATATHLAAGAEPRGAEATPRVLRSSDLDRGGSVNQVGGGPAGGPAGASKLANRPGAASRTTQSREQIMERYKATHPPGGVAPGAAAKPGPAPPGGGSQPAPYVPPVGSTGALELRLLPHDATGAVG
jgi:Flp pilus assembly protein TadD